MYESYNVNVDTTCLLWDNRGACNAANRFGFGLNVDAVTTGDTQVVGTSAVTSG